MSQQPAADVIYPLESRPPFLQTRLVAVRHGLAVFVGIARAIGLELADASYVVSMSPIVARDR